MTTSQWHWEQGVKYAVEDIKTCLLLNGAAAIAVMTFANAHATSSGMKWALLSFAGGAMLSALAFGAPYFAQLYYGNAEISGLAVDQILSRNWAVRWNIGTITLFLLSVVLRCRQRRSILHLAVPKVEHVVRRAD
jgi:hypothetical protein